MLGTNDATRMRDAVAERGNRVKVGLEEYVKNMRAIVERAMEASERVVVMTPPAVDERLRERCQRERWGKDWVGGPFEDHRPDVDAYARALESVWRECAADAVGCRVFFIDLYAETRDGMRAGKDYFEDGVHFNDDGQRLLSKLICESLKDWIDDESMVPDFPYGHEIRNPERETASVEEVFDEHEAKLRARSQNTE